MHSSVNLPAVYVANLMGLLLMVVMMIGNRWRLLAKYPENPHIFSMVIMAMIACIAEPIAFTVDGHQGMVMMAAAYISNTLVYLMNVLMIPCWILFLSSYLGIKFSKLNIRMVMAAESFAIVLLVSNLFIPIVFRIDAQNVYSRLMGYWYLPVVQLFFTIDSLVIYVRARRQSGVIKRFPVFLFIGPMVVGVVLQSVWYGISTIWPFLTISIAGFFICLENEMMFRDRLTGLYNRFYLETVKNRIKKESEGEFTVLMLDLNGFKRINDQLGHSKGDEALVDLAEIVRTTVGSCGEMIRYAGDEFIIILNTHNDVLVRRVICNIEDALTAFNQNSQKPYQLSVSIGCVKIDLGKSTLDELFNEVDKDMYEKKRKYYEEKPQFDRRNGARG